MFVLTETFTSEREIKKSRFATIAALISDEAAAKAFISANSFTDASHNCWAWRIGQQYRFSDDGEPGGTAGKPILQAIEGQDIDQVCVLVSRWFGGIKLGAGGLIRAYGGSAAECSRLAPKQTVIATTELQIEVLFTDLALVDSRIQSVEGLSLKNRNFDEKGAVFTVSIPDDHLVSLAILLRDLTNGRAVITPDVLAET